MVVRAPASHAVERVSSHLAQRPIRAQLSLLEQEEDGVRLRKLGCGSKAAIFGVVGVLRRLDYGVDRCVIERARAARDG